MPHDIRSWEWRDAATCQGTSGTDSLHQKPGRGKERLNPVSQKEHGPSDTMTLDFKLPELWDNHSHLKPPSSWYFITTALETNTEQKKQSPGRAGGGGGGEGLAVQARGPRASGWVLGAQGFGVSPFSSPALSTALCSQGALNIRAHSLPFTLDMREAQKEAWGPGCWLQFHKL